MGAWKFPCMLLNVFGHKSSHAEKVPFQPLFKNIGTKSALQKNGFSLFKKVQKRIGLGRKVGLPPPPPNQL
jgi:hypothetical protein